MANFLTWKCWWKIWVQLNLVQVLHAIYCDEYSRISLRFFWIFMNSKIFWNCTWSTGTFLYQVEIFWLFEFEGIHNVCRNYLVWVFCVWATVWRFARIYNSIWFKYFGCRYFCTEIPEVFPVKVWASWPILMLNCLSVSTHIYTLMIWTKNIKLHVATGWMMSVEEFLFLKKLQLGQVFA